MGKTVVFANFSQKCYSGMPQFGRLVYLDILRILNVAFI